MSSRTSILEVVTKPERWGYEKVLFHNGRIYPHAHREIVFRGDVIRSIRTGELWEFQYRIDGKLFAKPLDIRANF
jgi:hypothetical protein